MTQRKGMALPFHVMCVLERARRSAFLAEELLMLEMEASQMADSVLNQTLKNTLADVAGNIEIFMARAWREPGGFCCLTLFHCFSRCKIYDVYIPFLP